MSIPKLISNAEGSWTGTMKLHRSWLPAEKQVSESHSPLHIDLLGRHKFATLTYRWSVDGKDQEGLILICASDKEVQVGWSDSWHQDSGVLYLKGAIGTENEFKTVGSYKAGDQVWGWTIALKMDGEQLLLSMDNITPKGESDWAVSATYRRP